MCADHGWRPSTVVGYRSVAGFLTRDPLGGRRAVDLTPKVLVAACADWRSQGWPDPTVWARMRVLRSALGWAYTERILDLHPLDGMHSPPHAAVRMHAPVDHVRAILACARQQVIDAASRQGRSPSDLGALHRAEQITLLTRLAADSGARRGELAALQLTDLDGDVLTITRGTRTKWSDRPRPAGFAGSPSAPPPRPCGGTPSTSGGTEPARVSYSDRGCSPAAPTTPPDCPRPAWRTGSPSPVQTPATRTSPSTASGTPSPPPWSPKETSCRPKTGSGTATPPPRYGSTATSCH